MIDEKFIGVRIETPENLFAEGYYKEAKSNHDPANDPLFLSYSVTPGKPNDLLDRIKVFYRDRKFRFSCFNNGHLTLGFSYSLYLEENKNVHFLHPNNDSQKQVQKYHLRQLDTSDNNKIIAYGKIYVLKRISQPNGSRNYDYYEFVRQYKIIEFFKKLFNKT